MLHLDGRLALALALAGWLVLALALAGRLMLALTLAGGRDPRSVDLGPCESGIHVSGFGRRYNGGGADESFWILRGRVYEDKTRYVHWIRYVLLEYLLARFTTLEVV